MPDGRAQATSRAQEYVVPVLGFLERNLMRFHPRVRDVIGLGMLLVFMLLTLHGVLAPTFIQGSLYVQASPAAGKVQAERYAVVMRNESAVVNLWGRWMLPVGQGFLPRSRRIEIYDPSRQLMASHTFGGPWPLWHALSPLELELELHPYESSGNRLRLIGSDLVTPIFAGLMDMGTAWAQSEAPTQGGGSARGGIAVQGGIHVRGGTAVKGGIAVQGGTPVQDEIRSDLLDWIKKLKSAPALTLEIRSITIKEFPNWGWPIWAWTKSNGRVYFTVTKDGIEVDGRQLLTHRDLDCWIGQCYSKTIPVSTTEPSVTRAMRFPIKSVKDSWVPVREDRTEKFESLIANLTDLVVIDSGEGFRTVKPKGRIELHLWMDTGALVESFEITQEVLRKEGATTLGGRGKALVDVLPALVRVMP